MTARKLSADSVFAYVWERSSPQYDEYWIAAERVRELSPKLEAGDFDGRDPAEERHLLAQAEAADPDPRGEAV